MLYFQDLAPMQGCYDQMKIVRTIEKTFCTLHTVLVISVYHFSSDGVNRFSKWVVFWVHDKFSILIYLQFFDPIYGFSAMIN